MHEPATYTQAVTTEGEASAAARSLRESDNWTSSHSPGSLPTGRPTMTATKLAPARPQGYDNTVPTLSDVAGSVPTKRSGS